MDRTSDDNLQERKELIQDVIDRLLSNPDYKAALIKLNGEFPPLVDYNRRLTTYTEQEPSKKDK